MTLSQESRSVPGESQRPWETLVEYGGVWASMGESGRVWVSMGESMGESGRVWASLDILNS